MRKLKAGRRAAKSGDSKSLVILLHGYGADGNDLLGLADSLAGQLPDTVFVAPDAPNRCSGNPMGYEWFPIPWLDGSTEQAAYAGMMRALEDLDGFIDATILSERVTAAETILLGFSQGTMMSLQIAPRRAAPVAAVVGFSGRLLAPEKLAGETKSKPPVLLLHGDCDDMVPPTSMPAAAAVLGAAGFEVHTHVSKGMAHGIAPDGLAVASRFMRQKLGLNAD